MNTEEGKEEIVHGPCFLLDEAGHWGRRNTPAACDKCRLKRIRCGSFLEGAPCLNCRKASSLCVIQGQAHPAHRLPSLPYRPILPPPQVPANSPTLSSKPLPSEIRISLHSDATEIDFVNAVNERYKHSGNRPAPLVWRSIDEITPRKPTEISQSTTRARRSSTKASPKPAPKVESEEETDSSSSDENSSQSVSQSIKKDLYRATEAEEELVRPFVVRISSSKYAEPVVVKSERWEMERGSRFSSLVSSYSPTRSHDERYRKTSFPISSIRDQLHEPKSPLLLFSPSFSHSSKNSCSPSPSTQPSYTASSERHFDWG